MENNKTPTKDQQAQEYAEKKMENVYSQEWDSEYVEGLIESAFEDGYTAAEQSDLCISVAKLREVLEELASAPTLWQAQKWLREAKGIDVLVWNCACWIITFKNRIYISKADAQSRGTMLMDYDDNGEDMDSGMWLTYENALSAGIAAALELIKKGE